MSIRHAVLGVTLASVAAVGGIAVDTATAPEASALPCVQNVSTWQAFNKCAARPAHHWDAIRNSASKYGNWASAGQWSKQGVCWANVVSYGYTLQS
ncbi:hypothetical protein [Frondihabitans cladoniiphilus]|uniref:Transglycosylase-like protein with SLT domain n=1 Tax=Frondihabitans cladoniiphilus TaxID=715785 RepID=A0ABP8VXS8_9MICO